MGLSVFGSLGLRPRAAFRRARARVAAARSVRSRSWRLACAVAGAVTLLHTHGVAARDRVIVLGFDGVDARLTEQWMAEGKLPHLTELRSRGTFHPLQPTNPPQTPVSWSTFATGFDPGKHEIFDFLKRIPGTYYPDFALMSPGKETLLWGKRNPLLTGLLGAAAGLLVTPILFLALRARRRVALAAIVPLVGGLAAAGYAFGAHFLPSEIPSAINHRKGTTFWEYADRAGVKTRTIRVPGTFPATEIDHGTMLSGLGVPDIRGRIGTPSMYTSAKATTDQYDDFSVEVVEIPQRGRFETKIFGPKNQPFYAFEVEGAEDEARAKGKDPELAKQIAEDALRRKGVAETITIPLTLDIGDDSVTIETSGHTITLREGQWSEWLALTFPFNRIMAVRGIARFKVEALEPEARIYLSPVHFDARKLPPFVHLSFPHGFAKSIAERMGPFKTMGWSIDTWSLEEERISEETFLEDVQESVRHFRGMFEMFLEDQDVELYTHVFEFTDRVSHMTWHHNDPGHLKYDAEKAKLYGGEIEKTYRIMDEIVGEAMEKIDAHTHLIVLSDHGFATWRRAINYNTWLAQNGFMTLTGEGEERDLEALFDRGSFWPNVDWSRTKAFALGLGYIYINVLGREPQGTVLPGEEYDRVCREIADGLLAFVDPKTGLHPVCSVYTRDEIYRPGYDPDLIPDLRVCNSPGYRVSWQSSLGNTPKEVLYDKDKNWSADHCSLDPKDVPGIIFTSFPINTETPWIGDIFPTICTLMDLPIPEGLHGRSLR